MGQSVTKQRQSCEGRKRRSYSGGSITSRKIVIVKFYLILSDAMEIASAVSSSPPPAPAGGSGVFDPLLDALLLETRLSSSFRAMLAAQELFCSAIVERLTPADMLEMGFPFGARKVLSEIIIPAITARRLAGGPRSSATATTPSPPWAASSSVAPPSSSLSGEGAAAGPAPATAPASISPSQAALALVVSAGSGGGASSSSSSSAVVAAGAAIVTPPREEMDESEEVVLEFDAALY